MSSIEKLHKGGNTVSVKPKVPEFDDFYPLIKYIVKNSGKSHQEWADICGISLKTFKENFLSPTGKPYLYLRCFIRIGKIMHEPAIANLFLEEAGFNAETCEDAPANGVPINGKAPIIK
jgi:hypothetical protein